tara:strand:- start:922 stop:1161 length:240 start_codon:yes stop_codon:yes gene_type:complete
MELVYFYILFNICIMPFDEYSNAINPKPFPTRRHITMNWNKDDFTYFKISKEYVLLQYKEDDNKYKALARRYWYEQKTK